MAPPPASGCRSRASQRSNPWRNTAHNVRKRWSVGPARVREVESTARRGPPACPADRLDDQLRQAGGSALRGGRQARAHSRHRSRPFPAVESVRFGRDEQHHGLSIARFQKRRRPVAGEEGRNRRRIDDPPAPAHHRRPSGRRRIHRWPPPASDRPRPARPPDRARRRAPRRFAPLRSDSGSHASGRRPPRPAGQARGSSGRTDSLHRADRTRLRSDRNRGTPRSRVPRRHAAVPRIRRNSPQVPLISPGSTRPATESSRCSA